ADTGRGGHGGRTPQPDQERRCRARDVLALGGRRGGRRAATATAAGGDHACERGRRRQCSAHASQRVTGAPITPPSGGVITATGSITREPPPRRAEPPPGRLAGGVTTAPGGIPREPPQRGQKPPLGGWRCSVKLMSAERMPPSALSTPR